MQSSQQASLRLLNHTVLTASTPSGVLLLAQCLVNLPVWQADTLRKAVHALDLKRALVFMNFQQRLKDFQFKLEASKMKVGLSEPVPQHQCTVD